MEIAQLESSSKVKLDDGTVLTRCDQCRTMHAERTPPTEPPCDTCKVDLDPENHEAVMIYGLVNTQVIVAGDQPIDLNHLAVWAMIDRYEPRVKDPWECFEKVTRLYRAVREKERRG
jgi:hypothetical protein